MSATLMNDPMRCDLSPSYRDVTKRRPGRMPGKLALKAGYEGRKRRPVKGERTKSVDRQSTMANTNPSNGFQKGHPKMGGRKAGTPNKLTTSLKDDTLGAAEDVGMIEEHKIVDKDGKQTGGTRLLATGKDGRRGYLRWAAIHQPASFIGLLARFIPAELNVKTETTVTVSYETVEETREALTRAGR